MTIGRFRLPSCKSTWSVNRSPGCLAMSVLGAAQGALRGQRLRGSMRGRRLAGRNRKQTSLGDLPWSVAWGRSSLYQEKKAVSSERNRARRSGITILRVAVSFIVLMKRSTTAMLPCFPTVLFATTFWTFMYETSSLGIGTVSRLLSSAWIPIRQRAKPIVRY